MSVLCEVISVIVIRSALEVTYPGGQAGYERDSPNNTFCCDEHITRIGFMHPDDAQAFVNLLEARTGLSFVEAGRFIDIAIVDQMMGPTRVCDWLDFTRSRGATRAWLAGHPPGELAVPDGWRQADMRLVTWDEAEGLPIGESSHDIHTLIDPQSGAVRYVGRTPSGPAGLDRWHRDQLTARQSAGDRVGAYEAAEAWVESRSNQALAWYQLGLASVALKRFGRAVTAFRRAVDLSPDFHEAAVNLGSALTEHGASQEAIRILTSAIERGRPDPLAWFALANAHVALHDLPSAAVALRTCDKVALGLGDREWSEWSRQRLAQLFLDDREQLDS